MLLTLRDWMRFPNARIHYESKNKSFFKLANAYKNVFKIKNHAFLIAIIHPELANVDPFDPNLDERTMALIYRECLLNPFYMVRECVRIPPKGTTDPVMFEANRGNIAMLWCFFMHMTYTSIQPRQTGKSIGLFTLFAICLATLCKNTNINFYTKDDKLRGESIKAIKELISYLPPYLNPKTKGDPDNQEEIRFKDPRINNSLLTHLPQKDKKLANGTARGTTAPIFGGDEIPFCYNSHISVPAAIAAGNRARQNAKEAGLLYGNIFTTTAGKLDDKEGEYAYARLSSAAKMNEIFFDANDVDHLIELVDTNRRKLDDGKDPGPGIDGTFNHRQLGVSDAVHYDNIRQSGGDTDAINRDYFNLWSSGGSHNPLSNDILAAITLSEKEPLYTELNSSGIITNWYITREVLAAWPTERKMILGVDTSNAVGSDSCTGTFVDTYTLEVLGTFNFNRGSLISFIFEYLGGMMISRPYVIMIPENKMNGQIVIDGVVDVLTKAGIDPFTRIFNGIVQNKDDDRMNDMYKEISKPLYSRRSDLYSKAKKYFGFITAGGGEQSRSKLYGDVLETSTRRCKDIIHDRTLSREIKAITVKNGRLDHADGAHDDQLISWLLVNWLVMYGRNLSFYGIDISRIRIREVKELTHEDYYNEYKDNLLRDKIEEIKELMKVSDDRVKFNVYKNKLLSLTKEIDTSELANGIDSFINDLESEMMVGNNRAMRDLVAPFKRGFGGKMYLRRMNA